MHPSGIPSIENAQGRAKQPGPMFPFKIASMVCTLLVVGVGLVVDGMTSFVSVVASLFERSQLLWESPFISSALF